MALMSRLFLLYLLVLVLPGTLCQGCPGPCICKWKSGKQSAECVGQSLDQVPPNLNTGTQVLDLSSNPLRALPSRVFQDRSLVNLQKVFLAQCSLQQVAPDAFYQLTNLVELDMSRNLLEDVPSAIFSDTSQLRRLSLEGNPQILRLPVDAFSNLTYLSVLDLSACQIATIHPGAFRGLSRLEVLKLHDNRLTVITSDVLRTLPPLSAFSLHGNPWRCDCHLRDLKLWMTENNVPLGEPPRCDTPATLRQQSWASAPLYKLACRPRIVSLVRDLSVPRGDNATLECRVQASPLAKILWEVDGMLLNQSDFVDGLAVEPGPDYSLLTVSEALDTTFYLCIAGNEAGNDTANFTLSVVYVPETSVGWAKGKVIWVGLGIFLAAVAVVVLVGCAVALRYRALTSNDGKFNGVGILKQLAAKKTETQEVRASAEKPGDDKVPRHETGSSGYGSDQHTPDLTNKAEMQNGPTYSTKAFLYSHPVHDALTKDTYSIHEQCCLPAPIGGNNLLHRDNFHGYSNEFPEFTGYHDGYPDVQYSGSEVTLPPQCDLLQSGNVCPGQPDSSYTDGTLLVRGDGYGVPSVHVWKRTPFVDPAEFEVQPAGDRRYSPDEGYAEETLEGTEV